MAAERVAADQHDVDQQHQRADADAELRVARRRVVEAEALHDVDRQKDDEQQREVERVAVQVLDEQRPLGLAAVFVARLADGAGGRVGPERLVVGAAVVVAGHPEREREDQDQHRRRVADERDRPGPPPRAEDRVRRIAEQLRRIQRREVVAVVVVLALQQRPRHVDDEGREHDEGGERHRPPQIAAFGLTEADSFQRNVDGGHVARGE